MHEQINDFSVLINKHTCLSSLALLCISCLEFLTWNPESQVLVLSLNYHQFSSVESLNHVWLFATRWIAHARLPCPACWSLFRFMSIKSVMPSNHLILCRPLLLLPSVFPSIRVFSNESVLHIRWPKYWSFSFSISPSIEYLGLISFRIDWFDLLAVQGTLKSRLQHHSSKATILWCSAFFIVQLSCTFSDSYNLKWDSL